MAAKLSNIIEAPTSAGTKTPSGKQIVILLLVVNVCVIVGSGLWLSQIRNSLAKPRLYKSGPAQTAGNTMNVPNTVIKATDTYTSNQHHVSFIYPTNWDVQDTVGENESLTISSSSTTFSTIAGNDPGDMTPHLRSGSLIIAIGKTPYTGGGYVVRDSEPVTYLGRKMYATWVGSQPNRFDGARLTARAYKKGAQDQTFDDTRATGVYIGFIAKNVQRFSVGFDEVLLSDADRPEMAQAIQIIQSIKRN